MAELTFPALDLELADSGDLVPVSDPVLQDVLMRLHVQRGACFWAPDFGGRLHELRRAKVGRTFQRDLEHLINDALKPLTDAGAITSLSFQHRRMTPTYWAVGLTLTLAGNRTTTLTFTLEVA